MMINEERYHYYLRKDGSVLAKDLSKCGKECLKKLKQYVECHPDGTPLEPVKRTRKNDKKSKED